LDQRIKQLKKKKKITLDCGANKDTLMQEVYPRHFATK